MFCRHSSVKGDTIVREGCVPPDKILPPENRKRQGFRRRFAKEGGPFTKPTSELNNLHSIPFIVLVRGFETDMQINFSLPLPPWSDHHRT
jgi:hypothetical protein